MLSMLSITVLFLLHYHSPYQTYSSPRVEGVFTHSLIHSLSDIYLVAVMCEVLGVQMMSKAV
jgi:hypothetical protein